MTNQSALIVEDDESVQTLLELMLRKHCRTIDVATDGEEAMAMLRSGPYDVVVLDLMLPKANGFVVAEMMRDMQPAPRLIVLSAVARYFTDRFPPGTVVLQKPFDIGKLDGALRESGTVAPSQQVAGRE